MNETVGDDRQWRALNWSLKFDQRQEHLPEYFSKVFQANRSNYNFKLLEKNSFLPAEVPVDEVAGVLQVATSATGAVTIKGISRRLKRPSRYYIFLDDIFIKDVVANPTGGLYFVLHKAFLANLPKRMKLSVSCDAGMLISAETAMEEVLLENKIGTQGAVIHIPEGSVVTKKGTLLPQISQSLEWQSTVLDAYEEAREIFVKHFNYDLFLTYGTLLGLIRDGTFIAHDDDMDSAYLSRETTPESVGEEVAAITSTLQSLGKTIRLAPAKDPKLMHYATSQTKLDIFPSWFADGCFWMPNTTRVVADEGMIMPLQSNVFLGREVLTPRNAKEFLEKKYGQTWRIPDPGYRVQGASAEAKAGFKRLKIERR